MGERDVSGHIEPFADFDHVREMMRHGGALGGRRLGGADVHAAIDLHGIGGDDFGVEAAGQRERDGGFANGGGADEEKWSAECGV